VDVEVRDTFAGVGAVVDDEAVTAGEVEFFGYDSGRDEEVAELGLVGGRGFADAGDEFFGDDQEVDGSLRLDVVDDDAAVVLVLDLGGDFAVDDFLEEGFRHGGGMWTDEKTDVNVELRKAGTEEGGAVMSRRDKAG
jgi:hypothetical protein